MPAYADYHRVSDPFLDKRTKLLPCQKEMVHYWYAHGNSINSISRMFHVNKRLIQFVLFPERKKKNLEDRADRGGSAAYYKREKHTAAMSVHRKHKEKLFVKKS